MRQERVFQNRRGAILTVVAVSVAALLAITALAIDIGMAYSAHNEAQRVADAAALAGASAFLDFHPASAAVAPARTRAQEYVTSNHILGSSVDTSEADIEVNPTEYRVRVTVHRYRISTWFARIFNVDEIGVTAVAAAEAVNAGAGTCVRPWVIQDLWHEDGLAGGGTVPLEADHYLDEATPSDRYERVPPEEIDYPNATGYGAVSHPNRDWGKQLQLKAQSPVQNPNTNASELAQPGPGEFLIWQMPEDPAMEQCAKTNLAYSNEICGCNGNKIELGQPYPLDFGVKVGSTFMGLDALIAQDPYARWVGDVGGRVEGSSFEVSPRIVPIAIMAPLPPSPDGKAYTAANLNTVTFTNIANFFVESYARGPGGQPQITGRFLYYGSGDKGNVEGSLIKYLRLIE